MKSYTSIPVRNYHIDYFGHVNHARYVEMLEEARWRYLEENELVSGIHEVGAFHVVAQLSITYLKPAKIGEILRFETQIASRTNHSFQMSQNAVIETSCERVIEAVVTNVFVDGTGHSRLISHDILTFWPDLAAAPHKKEQEISVHVM